MVAKINGGPELQMNRPLQALMVASIVLPQLWCAATQKEPSAAEQLAQWLAWTLEDARGWLASTGFWAVCAALAFERALYTIVWLRPKDVMKLAKRPFWKQFGTPVDVVVVGFHVSKVLQFGSFAVWYALYGPVALRAALVGATRLQWVLFAQGVGLGQLLNTAIYQAIGKNGVYYGYKLGKPVAWCTDFPFNVFTAHPQYVGATTTAWGLVALLATEPHAKAGWFGLGALQAAMYAYMAAVEQYC